MSQEERPLSTRDLVERADTRPDSEPRVKDGAEPIAESREERYSPLFERDEAGGYRTRWEAIQAGFVDEPRAAVEQADALVAQVMKRLAESFASERASLEQQWDRGGELTTEDLRVALKRYRSFFERLLSL